MEVRVSKSLKICKVCSWLVKRGLRYWVTSVLSQIYTMTSMEVKVSKSLKICKVCFIKCWLGKILVKIAQQKSEISISLHFDKNVHNNLHEGQSAKINKNLQSVLKKPLNWWKFGHDWSTEAWDIEQPLILTKMSTMTSMEVKVPKSLKICKVCPKTTYLVKFWSWLVNRGLRYWAASVLSKIAIMTSMEVKIPKSLKICKVCSKTTYFVKFWSRFVNMGLR